MFIVFEGLDGSGSTTQAQLLATKLAEHGVAAIHTSEPTENPIGRLVRSALTKAWPADPAALQLLFSADRSQHLAAEIEPALAVNKWVVCDRYIWSTIAYGALSGHSEWLESVNRNFRRPDFTFLLQVPTDVCLERIAARGEKELFEEREKLEMVWKAFGELADEEENCAIIDGERPLAEVATEIWGIIEQKFLS